MKMNPFFRPCLAGLGLAFALSAARAQDTGVVPPPPLPSAASTSPTEGAPPHRKHPHPGYVLADLTQKLGLNAEQQHTVGAIIANARTQMKELRADETLTKEVRRQKGREILEASRTQIRSALTPDQQKIFDTLPAAGDRP